MKLKKLFSRSLKNKIINVEFLPSRPNKEDILLVHTSENINLFATSKKNSRLIIKEKIKGESFQCNGEFIVTNKGNKIEIRKINLDAATKENILSKQEEPKISIKNITKIACNKNKPTVVLTDRNGNIEIIDIEKGTVRAKNKIAKTEIKNILMRKNKLIINTGKKLLVLNSENINLTEAKTTLNKETNNYSWINKKRFFISSVNNEVHILQEEKSIPIDELCAIMKKKNINIKISQKEWEKITNIDNSDKLNTVPVICE